MRTRLLMLPALLFVPLALQVASAPAALALGAEGPTSATGTPPVPVAGVDAFGIGVGQLDDPGGLALDGRGDLFVADPNRGVVEFAHPTTRTRSATGRTVAGVGGVGPGPTQLALGSATQVALDSHGDLFVADTGNRRIQEFAYDRHSGTYAAAATTVAGAGVQAPGSTQLGSPYGVALDANGDLFVDDNTPQLLEFAYNHATHTFASTATSLALGTNASAGQLNLDARGDLFVADGESVLEFPYHPATRTYSTTGTVVADLASYHEPADALASDASGNLFVSYSYLGNGGVLEYTYNPTTGTFASAGVPVDPGAMIGPSGVAFDRRGNLYVSETAQTTNPNLTEWDMVLELSPQPSTGTFAPQGTVLGQLGRQNEGVSSLAVDGRGELFVADSVDDAVYEFRIDGRTGTYSPDGTLLGAGTVVTVDRGGDVFIASGDTPGVDEYQRHPFTGSYAPTGVPVPGATQLSQLVVRALAVDRHDDLFAAAGDQVEEFAYNPTTRSYPATGTVVAGVGGAGSGPSQLAGVGGSDGDAQSFSPFALALDTSGDLFVEDTGNDRVQEYLWNPATQAYAVDGITVARAGNGGIAVDHGGDLFVYGTGADLVTEYTGDSGTGAYSANGTVVVSEQADNSPEQGGVALDARGDLFFDSNFSSAEVYELAESQLATPPAVTPEAPYAVLFPIAAVGVIGGLVWLRRRRAARSRQPAPPVNG
jgi:sugar lactone lactonase YvrE